MVSHWIVYLIFYLSIEIMVRKTIERRSRARKEPDRYTPICKPKVKAVAAPLVRPPRVQIVHTIPVQKPKPAAPKTPIQKPKTVPMETREVKKRNRSNLPYVDKYGRMYYTHPGRQTFGLCNPIPDIKPVGISLRESPRHHYWKICWLSSVTTFSFGRLSGITKLNAYWEAVKHLSKLHFESAMRLRRSVDLSPEEEELMGELVELDEGTETMLDKFVAMDEGTEFNLHVAEDPHPFEVSDDFEVDFNLFDEFLKDYANFDI
jgi:hypothetical protein